MKGVAAKFVAAVLIAAVLAGVVFVPHASAMNKVPWPPTRNGESTPPHPNLAVTGTSVADGRVVVYTPAVGILYVTAAVVPGAQVVAVFVVGVATVYWAYQNRAAIQSAGVGIVATVSGGVNGFKTWIAQLRRAPAPDTSHMDEGLRGANRMDAYGQLSRNWYRTTCGYRAPGRNNDEAVQFITSTGVSFVYNITAPGRSSAMFRATLLPGFSPIGCSTAKAVAAGSYLDSLLRAKGLK